MAISLNNHEYRIKTLEGKIGAEFSDTGWINGTMYYLNNYNQLQRACRYRCLNSVLYFEIRGYVPTSSTSTVIANLPNWKYGEKIIATTGHGNNAGSAEGNAVKIDSSGNIRNLMAFNQAPIYYGLMSALTIYYIVRYNIYKLVRFLSHPNTKFGGERR